MNKKKKYTTVIDYFKSSNPNPETELHYSTPFQLLQAVILSAQCTDKRVNMVTPDLFKAFKTPRDLASSSFDEVYPYIKSVSFPNNKTKYLISMAKTLVDEYGGKIPKDPSDLQKLSGVGRKTAHVISSVLYGEATLAVDTHVFRVSRRIGLVDQSADTPIAVEKQLVENIPKKYIAKAHHWLILHGRYICKARTPLCNKCPFTKICDYFNSHK